VRALLSNVGFTISVLIAVVVTVVFAFVFGASSALVVTLLVLGLVTAIAEHVMRLRQQPPQEFD
jgi:thiamine transporter ThiT